MITHEESGGSDVLSYHLRWDKRTYGLLWYDLIGLDEDFLMTEFVHSTDVVPGNVLQFQVRSSNKWGWSEWSSITWVKASTWPADVAEPITSIDAATGGVLITW
jgi:hypothetical protein